MLLRAWKQHPFLSFLSCSLKVTDSEVQSQSLSSAAWGLLSLHTGIALPQPWMDLFLVAAILPVLSWSAAVTQLATFWQLRVSSVLGKPLDRFPLDALLPPVIGIQLQPPLSSLL